MSSFIENNLLMLKKSHYVRVASASNNYWFDFTYNVLLRYQKEYGDNFCLILHGSSDTNDAYVFPYTELKNYFTSDLLDRRDRWIGSVRNNIMRISAAGRGKSISVSRYYNAFNLLNFKYDPENFIVKESDIIKYEIDKILPDHLVELIKSFNKRFEEVEPEVKVIISNQIARPGLIADYVKELQNYSCQICKTKGFVQSNNNYYVEAHHIIELHKIVSGSLCSDNIIVVCPTCHKKLHYARVEYFYVSSDNVNVTINNEKYNFNRNIIS